MYTYWVKCGTSLEENTGIILHCQVKRVFLCALTITFASSVDTSLKCGLVVEYFIEIDGLRVSASQEALLCVLEKGTSIFA